MFPWKYSPFLQTKPALFPLSVTRPYLLPAGPENFLPIKLVLKTSCTLEAPAQPAASSTPHARNQPLYRLTMAAKYLVQHRGKKTYKMPRSFSKHFLLPHIYAKWFAAFWGDFRPSWVSPGLSFAENRWFWVSCYPQLLQIGILRVPASDCQGGRGSPSAGDEEDGQASWRHRMDGPSHPTTKGLSLAWSCPHPSIHAGISAGSALIRRSRIITSDLGLTFVKTCHSSSVSPLFWTFVPTTLKPQICQNTQRCCQRLSNSF